MMATMEYNGVRMPVEIFGSNSSTITAITNNYVKLTSLSGGTSTCYTGHKTCTVWTDWDNDDSTCNTWPYSYMPTSASCTNTFTIKAQWGNEEFVVYEGWGKQKYTPIQKTPKERLKEILQSRHAPVILSSRKPLLTPKDMREVRARETLFRLIGEDKFQKFLKDGFITVRAKSGLSYQIFPAHGITGVYQDGVQVERLCVVLRGDFPPTDSLIMRYLIILNDENRFRGYAIKHNVIVKQQPRVISSDDQSLSEIFRNLKARKVA